METFVKADIFFFVVTIAVVILSVVLTVAAIYLVRVLRELKSITTRVREETDEIVDDVHEFRNNIQKEEARMSFMFGVKQTISDLIFFTKRSQKSKRKLKKNGKKKKN